MKISINQPESNNVESIFLNGKRLPTCIEADDEEGYVVVLLPPKTLAPNDPRFNQVVPGAEKVLAVGPDLEAQDWEHVRLEGEVEIIMKQQDGLEDTPLEK